MKQREQWVPKARRWERVNEEREGLAEWRDEQRRAWGLLAEARTSLHLWDATKSCEPAVTWSV